MAPSIATPTGPPDVQLGDDAALGFDGTVKLKLCAAIEFGL
jgi:hypothetical protein